jgi:hypothetical protein
MELQAIKYVTGGVSLAAFLAVVIISLIRRLVSRDVELLKTVSGTSEQIAARERLVSLTLEKFVVDASRMSSQDQKEIALKQLEERRRRLWLVLVLVAFVAVCMSVISLFAVDRSLSH